MNRCLPPTTISPVALIGRHDEQAMLDQLIGMR